MAPDGACGEGWAARPSRFVPVSWARILWTSPADSDRASGSRRVDLTALPLACKGPRASATGDIAVRRLIDSGSRWAKDEGLCAFAPMAKAPRVGRVKTRLIPPLSPEEAAELS